MSSVWDHVTPVWYVAFGAAALWSHEREWEEPTGAGVT